jgi:hypothetical protein
MTDDQKFISAMLLGFGVILALWEVADAVYHMRVTIQLPEKPKGVLIDG